MQRLLLVAMLSLVACAKKEPAAASGSAASAPAPVAKPAGSAAAPVVVDAPPAPEAASPTDTTASDEVAALVVHDVGSKALGSQKIEASCVSVVVIPAQGDWTVAAARLNNCGDKTARSILWLYKRGKGAKWNEDYVGQPPKCWKGVPADLIDAVKIATKIPPC
jgi:hypothetical protein